MQPNVCTLRRLIHIIIFQIIQVAEAARPPTLFVDKAVRLRTPPTLRPHPIHLSLNRLDSCNLAPRPQLVGQFDHGESDHARIEAQGAAHGGLGGGGGVESHDEVVAGVVVGLIGFEWFGEEKWSPVGEATDNAARAQDEGAGIAGDSRAVA
jgi:hypothetical protein